MEDNFWVTSSDVDITSPEAQHLVDEALAAAPDEVVKVDAAGNIVEVSKGRMMPRQATRGICRLCGQEDDLTKEHIPPKASGNKERHQKHTFHDWLEDGPSDEKDPKRKTEQGGIYGYTLCSSCNSLTGNLYGNEYKDWAQRANTHLDGFPQGAFATMNQLPGPFGDKVTFGSKADGAVHPGAMIRQVLSCMCSLSGPWDLAGRYPEIRRIILEQSKEKLPKGMEIGMALYAGPMVRISGPQLRVDTETGVWRWCLEIAYPPFAFLMVIASNSDNPGLGVMMGDWTMLSPTEEKFFTAPFEIGFGWSPYPGDYRSRKAIEGMKAVSIIKQDGSGALQYGNVPIPRPGKDEVLIRVRACALNHLDLHLHNGRLNIPLPHISGTDVSGEVVGGLDDETRFKIGQAVVVNPAIPCGACARCKKSLSCEIVTIFGYKTQGGFAEFVTVPIAQVYPMPKNLSFVEAAAFPLTFLTAWHMLVGRADLQKGETVFIWGASGGLGSAAIQIAKHLNTKVIAAAKNDDDAKKIKAMGADEVIIYTKDNVVEEVKRLNGGTLVDVVFESVGAKTWATTLAMLRPYGRVVIAGTTSGEMASQDLSDVYYYQHTILGSRMGTPEEFEQVLKLVEAGKLKPTIDKVFPLKDFQEAECRLEESKQVGKIVIEI
jgi:NADPH:quinone reductase-like Zn-dependent oxidoreductase